MTYLAREKIPFILRLRENQYISREGYASWTLAEHAQSLKRGGKCILKGFWRLGGGELSVRIILMRLKTGELLALAPNTRPANALARYCARWSIETLFGNLKTRGFDLEATYMKAADKIVTLLVAMTIATALTAKSGHVAHYHRPVPIKAHGRKAVSVFALDLTVLRKTFATKPCTQVNEFLAALVSPKLPTKPLIGLGF